MIKLQSSLLNELQIAPKNYFQSVSKYSCMARSLVSSDRVEFLILRRRVSPWLTRPRPGGAVHKHHQDHINEKGMNSMNHCSLVHKFIPMLEGGSGEGIGKIGENPGIAADGSQKQERSDRRSKE